MTSCMYEESMTARYHCSECGGRLLSDQLHGELVCQNCGLVSEEGLLGKELELGDVNGEAYEQGQPMRSHHFTVCRRLGSSMLSTRRDGKGKLLPDEKKRQLWRLEKMDQRSGFKSGTERNLNQALKELRSMCLAMGLPEHVASTSALYYKFAVKKRLTVGRTVDDLLCAAIYCACLRTNYPLTLAELSRSLRTQGWKGSSHKKAGKAVKLLKRELQLKVAPPTPQMLIDRFCCRLELGTKTQDKTRDILFRVKEKGLLGGRPGGIAAAAIYVASRLCGEKVSQKHLAELAGVTDVTVRHQYKMITRELDISIA